MNRLEHETSPYLLQHKDNPVDWYPWGPEAFAKAAAEDKPIFLSIGYSSCHWCHVMAHESFENDAIAAVLNRHFVSIKVDREERPDVDEMYMKAVITLTGQGGWPLSVFLTPDRKPFYGGTYFPPVDRWGRPGFTSVLTSIERIWRDQRTRAVESADELLAHVQAEAAPAAGTRADLDPGLLDGAVAALDASFDAVDGGFGSAPKFPHAMDLALLLRLEARRPAARVRTIVTHTLRAMAYGGIYDQLGGGFHRYSTDDHWLVPHFEKMLYDNALLAPVYAEAYQVSGDPLFARIARETLEWALREMRDAKGAFHCAQDADSEGEEGKFFAWTRAQFDVVLGKADAEKTARLFGLDRGANFEHGTNVLHQTGSEADRAACAEAIQALERARAKRVRPGQDDKILVEWNGLMISAFARAGAVLGEVRYVDAAIEAATFVLDTFGYEGAGELRLLRTYRAGKARVGGFLSDYANLVEALLDLAAVSDDPRWLNAARRLLATVTARFADPAGGYHLVASDQEQMPARSKDPYDNAVPSGNSTMAANLVRLYALTGDAALLDAAWATVASVAPLLRQTPHGFGRMLQALDLLVEPPTTVVIAGERGADDLAATVLRTFRPGVFVVRVGPVAAALPGLDEKVPIDGAAAAYVCVGSACRAPVTTVAALDALLEKAR
ncbi:MAG: thioredoxin domain-containing protein [Planctomycetes bacterium]|nr:thioredoxin domain-containing protein [Planctomycetota bacterium]MCC7172503.1 thioredoxin domain-containing protein [Planctomycetota bacterium]